MDLFFHFFKVKSNLRHMAMFQIDQKSQRSSKMTRKIYFFYFSKKKISRTFFNFVL